MAYEFVALFDPWQTRTLPLSVGTYRAQPNNSEYYEFLVDGVAYRPATNGSSIFFDITTHKNYNLQNYGSYATIRLERYVSLPGPNITSVTGNNIPGGLLMITVPGGYSYYNVQFSTDGGVNWGLAVSMGTTSQYDWVIPASVPAGATILFRAQGLTISTSEWTQWGANYSLTLKPPNTPPTTPSSLSVTGSFKPSGAVTLTWGASTDAEGNLQGYMLQYSTDNTNWVYLSSLGAGTTSTVWSIPANYTAPKIYFRVYAYDTQSGNSPFRYSTAYTMSYNSAPTVPASLTATGTIKPGTQITLTSGVATDPEGSTVYYQYQYTMDGANSWTTISTVASTTVNFTIPASITSKFIQFRVRTYDQTDYSGWRTSSEYTVLYNNAPSAPTAVYVENFPTYLTKGIEYTIMFTGATDVDGDAITHHVAYSTDGTTWTNVSGSVVGTSVKFVIPTTLTATNLTFRARAYDGTSYSEYKNSATYTLNNAPTITVDSPSGLVEYNEGDKVLLSGSYSDVSPNQVVNVFFKIADSKEIAIASSVTGGTDTLRFERELTFKDNAIWSGTTKLTTLPLVPTGDRGTANIQIYAKDNVGGTSSVVTKTLTFIPNKKPTIQVSTNELTSKEKSVNTFRVTGIDPDLDKISVNLNLRGYGKKFGYSWETEINNKSFEIVQYNSNLYIPQEVFNGDFTSLQSADALNQNDSGLPVKLTTGTYYLDIFVKDEHEAVSETKTITINVTANRAPVLTINTAPPIMVVTDGKFTYTGKVSDLDVDSADMPTAISAGDLKLGLRVNGGEITHVPILPDGTFTYDYTFTDADVGKKTLVFIADDKREVTSVTQEFEIVDEKILFEFKNPVETDLASTKVSIILGHYKTHDAVLKVEICNNAFDEEPTWEDVTVNVLESNAYTFTNTTKTAEKWGINLRVELVKNTAPTIYVDRIGILFE